MSAAAAMRYADLGWPVLPCWWIEHSCCGCGEACSSPGKHPLVRHGLKDATVDPAVIMRWWRRWPKANVAIATGERAGLFVVDVDGATGERSLVELVRRHGPLPDAYPMQWTGGGRGGWQAFFAWPAGRSVRNSAGRLGPKLDVRANGGYVVVPPSVTTEPYRWADDRAPWHLSVEPAPAWLVELLDPPAPPRSAWQPPNRARGSAYALAALRGALERAANAPAGQRNDTLNASAHSLFGLVAAGDLDRDIVACGLEQAAIHAGQIGREIGATIRSAARARGVAL
jgi:hypothetical protein